MGPRATKAAAGGVAAGLAAMGVSVDTRLGTRPLAMGAAAGAAAAYIFGTFAPRSTIFGKTVAARASRDSGAFALTFDDGPDPRHTPEISRILARRGHRATFFVLGQAVKTHPEVAATVLEDGHELACHGDDHRLLAFATPSELRRQIAATESAVRLATGTLPARLFRPPHGIRSPWLTRVVEGCGYRICAWDGYVFDTAQPGAAAIVARVGRLLRPGAIILLHDGDGSGRGASRRQTVEALPGILDAAERRGLRALPLSTVVGGDAAVG
jgi:peptidoglycan/xylan/chitin deacetylase (PgdA/CDA1 family)